MKLYGVRTTVNEGVFHTLSCDEGWVWDQAKQQRRSWTCCTQESPILIEFFEIDVDLDNVDLEEYFRGEGSRQ